MAVTALALVGSGSAADGELELLPVATFSTSTPIYVAAPSGDGERVFVVQQEGLISLVRSGTSGATEFLDIDLLVRSGGEQGLFSMAFAPEYATSGRFYVFYTAEPDGALTIAEYIRSGNPDVANPLGRIVLSIPHADAGNHNGGQLQFGPDGYLYIATGDGGGGGDQFGHGQNRNSLLGKLLRIDPRPGPGGEPYTTPADNPFVGQPGVRGEIWSYGLRNPWRFSFDRLTGDLTIGDVGQGVWEEIDFAPAAGAGRGTNFGWGCWEGRDPYGPNASRSDCNPLPTNHVQAVWQYSHARGCSITGGYVVRDPALASLAGRYLYGDFCDDRLWSTLLQVPERRTIAKRACRCRACTPSARMLVAGSTSSPARDRSIGCTLRGRRIRPACRPPSRHHHPLLLYRLPPRRRPRQPHRNRRGSRSAACRASSVVGSPPRRSGSAGPAAARAESGTGAQSAHAAGC